MIPEQPTDESTVRDKFGSQSIAVIVREEVMGVLPRIHEAVAFAVRKEFAPIETLVQKLAAQAAKPPDAESQLRELETLRRALDEKKETKQRPGMSREGSDDAKDAAREQSAALERIIEDSRAEDRRDGDRRSAELLAHLQGDIRRIMKEELGPVSSARECSASADGGGASTEMVELQARSPRPSAAARSPRPSVSRLLAPSSSASTPIPCDVLPRVQQPVPAPALAAREESSKEAYTPEAAKEVVSPTERVVPEWHPDTHHISSMQTEELKDFVGSALENPMGEAAAAFEQDFAEAMYNPKVMEAALFKLLPKSRCSRALRPVVHWALNVREPTRSGPAVDLVYHHRFQLFLNVVILLNAGFAAYVADWEMKNINKAPGLFMNSCEVGFMCIYLFELLLKLFVHRLFFFCNDEWTWNNFDFLLVMLSLYEQVLAIVGVGNGSSVTFMRIFRLLKLSKILRLFRALKFLQELRLMMAAIARTMSALFWALVFVTFFFFVFGLVMVQGLTGYLSEEERAGTLDPVVKDDITAKFGSMTTTMLTLYQVTTGGDDWSNAYNTVVHAGSLYSITFLFYIAFFVFAVMNILTGMIVENVTGLAAQDEEAAVLSYRRQRQEVAEEARNLFLKLDDDGSGHLTEEEFDEALKSDQMHALMSAMDLDVQDGHMFFEILRAASGTNTVDINGFINGCMRMKGNSTAIDMQCALTEIRAMHVKIAALNTARPSMEGGTSI